MSIYNEIIRLIDDELKKRGWFRKNLADELKISESWFSRLIKEEKLTIKQLLKIAEVLEIDPASLIPSNHHKIPQLSFDEYIRRIVKEEINKEKKGG